MFVNNYPLFPTEMFRANIISSISLLLKILFKFKKKIVQNHFHGRSLDLYCQLNQIAQMVDCHARDLEVRGLNPGPGLNFSLEFKL